MIYKDLILNRLLDKYEKSVAYIGKNVRRRITLKMLTGEFCEYDIEKSEARELINSTIYDLSGKGLIGFEWLKHDEGNIIQKIWLKLDRIDESYAEAGRISKKDEVATVLQMLLDLRRTVVSPWIVRFIDDCESMINAKNSAVPFLPDSKSGAGPIIAALDAIDKKGDAEYLERVFSLRCYGDSKYFEKNVRRKIVWITRRYLLGSADLFDVAGDVTDDVTDDMTGGEIDDVTDDVAGDVIVVMTDVMTDDDVAGDVIDVMTDDMTGGVTDDVTDDDVLSQIGIVKSPEQIEFCGPVCGKIEQADVDFSIYKQGIAINSYTVSHMDIKSLGPIRKVIFIENKANYIDYVVRKRKTDELVIYHGGFYSPIKGFFFHKIHDAGRDYDIEFCHWSDIDIGGFRIFCRLKSNIIPELKPMLMDRDSFISKRKYWMQMDQKYCNSLKKLLNDRDCSVFHDLISFMVTANARLEQEAFLSQ